jgi:hypothetical protein
MGFLAWIQTHWFDFFQSLGIISGLFFTAVSLRRDSKVRRLSNLLTFTAHHREIWRHVIENPELARVLEAAPNLKREPISRREELLVLFVTLHLSGMHEAIKKRLVEAPQGLQKDFAWFFSLPIPRTVWQQFKGLQDEDFVRFVESALFGNAEAL